MSQIEPPAEPVSLRWRRPLARVVLWFERLWPMLSPALWVAGAFLCLALLDLPPRLPWWGHTVLLAVAALGIAWLLWRGSRRLVPPDRAAADRRLERDSGLSHRPLAALRDKPAGTNPADLALWRIHVARGLARVSRLRLGWPSPGTARLDPRAMRHGVLLALVASLTIAGQDAPGRILAAFQPGLPRAVPPRPIEVQAWVTPPGHTRLAPLFLKRDQAATVPDGSQLTVNVTGGTGNPELIVNDQRIPFAALDQTSFQTEQTLSKDGRVAVVRDGRDLAAWNISVTPDQAPSVKWTEPPGRSDIGTRIRLPWTATDDYGVTALQAEIVLTERLAAPKQELAIPLPNGAPKSAHGIHQQDLVAHPWAGLSVTARLVARDGSGQTGVSEPATFDLPERVFHNEIAKALIEMRKGLSLHPAERGDALTALDGLMQDPDKFGADSGSFLNLSTIYYLMVRNRFADMIAQAQSRMWDLAIHLEEGQTEETAKALEAARQAVRDALEKVTREPTDANRQALEKRLEELRQAIDRHMKAMLEEAERNHTALPFDPEAEQLTNQDLKRLAEEAEKAAREGRMDEAREKMEALERLLDRLKEARAEKGQGNSQQRQKGSRQMGAVQDMVAREGGLLDHAESRADQSTRPRRIPPVPGEGDPAAQRQTDQRVQQALRRALGELMQQFGDLTGELPPALTEADQAMRESGRQLSQGDDKGASASQQRAIEALQKGAREMGRTLARQFGRGRQGAGEGGDPGEGDGFGAEGPMEGNGEMGLMPGGRRDSRSGRGTLPGPPGRADSRGRDPLGRTNQGNGLDGGDVRVPEEAERQRTQAIQEELRRRGADRERPRRELDYIDRLLRQF